MKTLRYVIFFVLGACWLHSPIQAQTPEPSLDGRIDLGSNTSFEWRVGDLLAEGFTFDEMTLRKLISDSLSNHRLEPAEIDAFKELSRTDVKTVTFTVNSLSTTVPVVNAEGRRIIDLVLNPVDMEALWANGPEGVRALGELHGLSVAHKNNIKKFIAMKMQSEWAKSNLYNQYEPFRKALGAAHVTHNGEVDRVHNEVCTMYFDGVKYLDAVRKDTIPDHLYAWLSPKRHSKKSD